MAGTGQSTMLQTKFTELLGCTVPLQQAGMGKIASPALATAVAEAGGLGMVSGIGAAPPEYVARVLDGLRRSTSGAFGANFIVAGARDETSSKLDPDFAKVLEVAASRAPVVEFCDPVRKRSNASKEMSSVRPHNRGLRRSASPSAEETRPLPIGRRPGRSTRCPFGPGSPSAGSSGSNPPARLSGSWPMKPRPSFGLGGREPLSDEGRSTRRLSRRPRFGPAYSISFGRSGAR